MDGVDLDGEVRQADPDRWLASRFIADPRARAEVVTLYAFDHQLTRASVVTSNPLTAQIRLTWWREAVDEIFAGGGPKRHPTLQALAEVTLARGLPREPFETMIEARIEALERPRFEPDEALAWALGTQGGLARQAARVLGGVALDSLATPAGVVWGLVLLRRAGKTAGAASDDQIRSTLDAARRAAVGLGASAFPSTLCATLARADLKSDAPSDLEKRVRLTWAALTGRL